MDEQVSANVEHEHRPTRRGLLGAAGLATAAGGMLALVRTEDAAAATLSPVTAINVKDAAYGAKGDGVTDDHAAIQKAFNDAPYQGASIFFPPGDYRVSKPLRPGRQTLVHGTHSTRFMGVPSTAPNNPDSSCKIRCADTFTGGGLIQPAAADDPRGVTFRNIALVGDGRGTGVHGVDMSAAISGEHGWSFEDVTIAGFTGCGVFGRMQVVGFINCHIHSNADWGIRATDGHRWNDCKMYGCYVTFNRNGALWLGGTSRSGANEFVNCRFERSGNRYGDPANPLNPDAPGIKLSKVQFIMFANCYTDANTGNGVEIGPEAGAASNSVHNCIFSNCVFSRDGTGDNVTLPARAGVRVVGGSMDTANDGANLIGFHNCIVGRGVSSDDGGGVVGPRYGVWYQKTEFFQWVGGFVDTGFTDARAFYNGGSATPGNHRPLVVDMHRSMSMVPLGAPTALADGAVYFDEATNKLMVRTGGTWKGVLLS